MPHMTGKVGIITGAGSGIGRATAEAFVAHGAKVMVADFDEEHGRETVASIEASGGEAVFTKVDVTDEDSVKEMAAAAKDAFGKVDALVNCAGISAAGAPGPLHEIERSAFERLMAVNVTGTFLAMKHVIPLMLESDGGAVVNLSSTIGERGAAGDPSYTTSKHAVRGLTKSAALSYAEQGVRVNCIGPGVVRTAMTAPVFEDEQTTQWLMSVTPMRRFAEPGEIAPLIRFLCSDAASYITGAYYPIDGGWLAG
jgi:NAD(P)-dependent dehydrogenase (short-subunit alcohol dehydrogenase family)